MSPREYVSVSQAHEHAMDLLGPIGVPNVEALRAEAAAVFLAFERRTSPATRRILLTSLANIARDLAETTGLESPSLHAAELADPRHDAPMVQARHPGDPATGENA